jgi:ribosomal protein S18 acetylase RimI-like enzyme
MTSPRIVRAGLERVDDLRPLWQSLHAHHAEVAPQLAALGGVRTPAESWGRRRALYEDWLSEPDAFALIAEAESVPVGYALVHMRGPEETWSTPDRIAEIETLTVLPAHRGRGVGGALVRAVYRELNRIGVGHLAVGVIASNTAAVRFYERLGLLPFLVSFIGPVQPANLDGPPTLS